ncbi:superinfection exclusion B family protein [Flavobacterium psychrophilum]|nr:superinfection exclusion B family protein [Flavobacterium psychrophilum]
MVTGFFIFSTPEILKKFKLEKFEEYAGYISLAFLFTTVLVFVNFIIWVFNKINYEIKFKKVKAEIKQTVKDLDYREQSVLREFFLRGQSSISMPIDNDVISGLLDKKVLKMNRQINGSTVGYGMKFPLSINNYVNEILTNEDIQFIANPTDEQKNQILENRPDWAENSRRY